MTSFALGSDSATSNVQILHIAFHVVPFLAGGQGIVCGSLQIEPLRFLQQLLRRQAHQ
ncbi:MAG: hypothetical protein WA968_04005 [Castellaniella sp.]